MRFKTVDDAFRAKISSICPTFNSQRVSNAVLTQLMYATNDFELKRALYRIEYFFEELTKAAPLSIFQNMTETRKEVLLALTAIDACKGSVELVNDSALPKDTVVWFFATLQRMPEIHPAFQGLSEDAKAMIRAQLFYLHERHVFFGEVPVAALAGLLMQSAENLQLLHGFWMINLLGFYLDKKASDAQVKQFSEMQTVLNDVVDQHSMDSLVSFYQSFDVPEDIQDNPDAIIFLGRLMKLLSGDPRTASAKEACFSALTRSLDSIVSVAAHEKIAYEKKGLLAVTFLPAVFWSLLELAKKEVLRLGVQDKWDEKTLTAAQLSILEAKKTDLILQTLGIFLQLQRAIFKAIAALETSLLAGNVSISMQFLSKDLVFLNQFRQTPLEALSLSIDMYGSLMDVAVSFVPTLVEESVDSLNSQSSFLFSPRSAGSSFFLNSGSFSSSAHEVPPNSPVSPS